MNTAASVVVFAGTYVLIATRRIRLRGLDRAAAALLGAVLMVAVGGLTAQEALAAIDEATLLLLFGMMGMAAFLVQDGGVAAIEDRLTRACGTPARLLGGIVWSSGVLSAFVTNDATCVLGVPVVLALIRRHALPPLPFLLALATGSNTGSVATVVGNPQNMLCALRGPLDYAAYAKTMVPLAVVCLALNHALLVFSFRRSLPKRRLEVREGPPAAWSPELVRDLVVLGATAAVYAAGGDLAFTAAGGLLCLLVWSGQPATEVWKRIDGSLLVFFGALFVVVAGFSSTKWPHLAFAGLGWAQPGGAQAASIADWLPFVFVTTVGSNLVSNVPFILVIESEVHALADASLGWQLLAMASTFAGNLTLVGSVANLIVAEAARSVGGIGFWAYLRVGLPLCALTTLVGTAWVVGWHP